VHVPETHMAVAPALAQSASLAHRPKCVSSPVASVVLPQPKAPKQASKKTK
jgi:hypothetical protein